MAWDGTVYRHISAVTPDGKGGSVIIFDCGHEQPSRFDARWLLRLPGGGGAERPATVCVACSRHFWDKISRFRSSIDFDQVIEKLGKRNER